MKSFTYLASAMILLAAVPTSATFGLQETKPDKTLKAFEGDWVIDTVATKSFWKEQRAAGTFEMPPSLQQESESTKEYYLKNGSNTTASHVCFSFRDGKATINSAPSTIEVDHNQKNCWIVKTSDKYLPDHKFRWNENQLICNLLPDKDINSSDHRIGPFVMQKLNRRPIPKRFHGTWVLDKQATKKRWKNMVTDGLISRTTSLVNKLFEANRIKLSKSGVSQFAIENREAIAWNHRISRNRIFAKFRSEVDLKFELTSKSKLVVYHEGHFRLPRIFRLETKAAKRLREASRDMETETNKLDSETSYVGDASSTDLEGTKDSDEIVQVPDALIGEWVPDIIETKRYLRDHSKLGIIEPEHAAFFVDVLKKHAFHIHLGKEKSFFEHTKNGKRTEIKNFLIEYGMVHLDSLVAMHLADDLFLVDIGMFYTWVVFKKLKPSETRLQIPTELRSTWQFNPEKTRELWKQLVADEKLTQTYFDLKWNQIESQFRDIRFSKYELSITLNRLLKEQVQSMRPLKVNSISKERAEILFTGNEEVQTRLKSKNELYATWKYNVSAPCVYDRFESQIGQVPDEFIGDWKLNVEESIKLQKKFKNDIYDVHDEYAFFWKLADIQFDGGKSKIQIDSDKIELGVPRSTFEIDPDGQRSNGFSIGLYHESLEQGRLGSALFRLKDLDARQLIVSGGNQELQFVLDRTSKPQAYTPPKIPPNLIGDWEFDKTATQDFCMDLSRDGSLLNEVSVYRTGTFVLWRDWESFYWTISTTFESPFWKRQLDGFDGMEINIDAENLSTNLFTSSTISSRIKSIRTIGNAHHLILTYGEQIHLFPAGRDRMIVSYINVFQPSELIRFVVKRKASKK